MTNIEPEHIRCSSCGKWMIKRGTGRMLPSCPAQYPWEWWCGCGHTKPGGIRRGTTQQEITRGEWERVNCAAPSASAQ